MRARYPDCDAIVARDGVEIRYERYGQGRLAILLLPAWSLVHSRHWKMQIPYLARHFTVVCFDGRGSGGSDRPADASAYSDAVFASDALAVMDAAGIGSAVLVSVSRGALWALRLCAEHPDRVLGAVFIAPTARLMPPLAERRVERFDAVRDYDEGVALARCTGGALVSLAGAGHFPHARDPVRVNLLIKQFADRIRQ
jgi:pimeloyl-ACP methyl ester carboxylesterase